jgi:hypothetical protein
MIIPTTSHLTRYVAFAVENKSTKSAEKKKTTLYTANHVGFSTGSATIKFLMFTRMHASGF